MLLVVDIGNTNSVFAVHDGSGFTAEWRCETVPRRTADEYFVWLESLMSHCGLLPGDIRSAVMASVVPGVADNVRRLTEQYFGTVALAVGDPGCDPGIELRVDRPRVVGADRIANAVGAGVAHGTGLIVVDFGTATTFDVIDSDGAYAGGVIAPGINLSIDALAMAAASLPRIGVERPRRVVGTDTEPAMRSGIYWGYVSLIDGICTQIERELGLPMRGIGTGGLAPLFEIESRAIEKVDPHLTIRGLVEIHRRNAKSLK